MFASIKIVNGCWCDNHRALWHHGRPLINRHSLLLHVLLLRHELRRLGCAQILLLLLLLHHLRLVVLVERVWRMLGKRIRILIVGQHEALHGRLLSLFAILEQQRLVCLHARLQHEVLLVSLLFLEVLVDGLLGNFFLRIGHFAYVGAPSCQPKTDNEVEDANVDHEPPPEGG